jgi:hypothetical protein
MFCTFVKTSETMSQRLSPQSSAPANPPLLQAFWV